MYCRGLRINQIAERLGLYREVVGDYVRDALEYFRDRQSERLSEYYSAEFAANQMATEKMWELFDRSPLDSIKCRAMANLIQLQGKRLEILRMVAPEKDESIDTDISIVVVKNKEEWKAVQTATEHLKLLKQEAERTVNGRVVPESVSEAPEFAAR